MAVARPSFERRQLGLTLRRLRTAAGKSQQEAADAFGKVRSRIVHLEEGLATATERDLTTLLDYYGVTGEEERETVLALGARARERLKRRTHIDSLPDAYQRFADLEASASEINWFETGIIPGLLQSEGYVRAVLDEGRGIWWKRRDQEGDDRLAYRLARQQRVFGAEEPKMLRFVFTEGTLRGNLGGPEIMREQCEHILTLLKEHRDLTVRVLPDDVSGNPARGNSLLVFGFGDRGEPIGYSCPVLGPSTYYDDEKDTSAMRRAFYRVWELALSRRESRRLIERVARE